MQHSLSLSLVLFFLHPVVPIPNYLVLRMHCLLNAPAPYPTPLLVATGKQVLYLASFQHRGIVVSGTVDGG